MPPQGDPESDFRPGHPPQQRTVVLVKPPLPTRASSRSREAPIEVQVPSLIAGALITTFATAVADALGNELLTHYYLPDERLKINLDTVVDRIIVDFTQHLWDELFEFYQSSNAEHGNQVTLLFEGPIRQIILILHGPEVSKCILDRIAPGLSRRPLNWTETASGVDPSLALLLLCGYWHRTYTSRSPGGNPDDIARSIASRLLSGESFTKLIARFKKTLYTPHLVQIHLTESAVWDLVFKKRRPPPPDGFHLFQFRIEFNATQCLSAAAHQSPFGISSLPAITGTASDCGWSTLRDYTSQYWPRNGGVVLRGLEKALADAVPSHIKGEMYTAMSFWESSDPEEAALYPGLRLLHVEVEPGAIRVTASAWVSSLVDIMRQLSWTCAALSSSPSPESIVECRTQIAGWNFEHDSTCVNLSLVYQAVPCQEAASWLRQHRGTVVATGFPIRDENTLSR